MPALLDQEIVRGRQRLQPGAELVQESFDGAVRPVVQQAAESQAWDVREPAREHFSPGFDRSALGITETVSYGLHIPKGLSFLATGDPNATIQGLAEFPVDQRPLSY